MKNTRNSAAPAIISLLVIAALIILGNLAGCYDDQPDYEPSLRAIGAW